MANFYRSAKGILADAVDLGPKTSFTLHRGSVDGAEYGIVRRANGDDVCTAQWNAETRRWHSIEFVNPASMKCNRTRQAAMRFLQAVERK